MINIVLYQPEIPPNTGNIARMCASLELTLHLVKPLGFSLEDKELKRAGLDYWPHVDLKVWENLDEVLTQTGSAPVAFCTTHGQKMYTQIPAQAGMFLIFGRETSGFPLELYNRETERLYRIPMTGKVRSLNLATAAGIIAFDCMRRINRWPGPADG